MGNSNPNAVQRFFLHYPEGHRVYVCIVDQQRRAFDFSDNTFKSASKLASIKDACLFATGRYESRADHECSYAVEVDLARLLAGTNPETIPREDSAVTVHWLQQEGDEPDVSLDLRLGNTCLLRNVGGRFEIANPHDLERQDENRAFESRAKAAKEYSEFILREIDSQKPRYERLEAAVNAGNGVRRDVATFIANYFECSTLELLAPRDPCYLPPLSTTTGMEWEWSIDEALQRGGRMAANGLHFVLFRMKHRHTGGQLGRGKFYLLSGLAASDRDRKREQLQRHPVVCSKIGRHPNLAEVISSTPTAGEDGWWVVERWIDGTPLSEILSAGRFQPADLPRLMREIASGLSALHRAQIVMRELAPSRVLLAKADGRAVLTDFELAKLLAGGPTVSPGEEWPEDPYRAEEVGPGEVTVQADLYSWARVLVHAATGHLPGRGEDIEVVARCGLPKRVWVTVQSCLEPAPSNRPASMEDVEQVIRDWKWRGSVDGQ